MSETRAKDALLRSVERDLRPVRPLPLPWKRALALVPLGIAVVVGSPVLWGFRPNLGELGLAAGFGVSSLQALAGLLITGLALRESVPGRELSRGVIALVLAGAGALVVVVTIGTYAFVPTRTPPGLEWRYSWECFYMALPPGLVPVAAAAALAARALPGRPAIAGALYGLGAGLMADSGARLFCRISSPGHVFLSHGAVVVALILLGAVLATWIEIRRESRTRHSLEFERPGIQA